jgi:hypothetical protein
MSHDTRSSEPRDDQPPRHAGTGDVTVQELTWALVDDQINDGEFQLLESMLLSDDAARHEYLDCIQLHTDLLAHFAAPAGTAVAGESPVLSFLGGGFPPIDKQVVQP